MRTYTGINDGIASGVRPGLLVLVEYISKSTQGWLWNNGTYANRKMRGKSSMSVHATGRAADLSYRQITRERMGKGRPWAVHVIRWLTSNADALGLEMILDYMPEPHGRGWRCDRNGWEKYKKPTISGAPYGDWIHIEISPKMADDEDGMRDVIANRPLPPLELVSA